MEIAAYVACGVLLLVVWQLVSKLSERKRERDYYEFIAHKLNEKLDEVQEANDKMGTFISKIVFEPNVIGDKEPDLRA